MLYSDIRLKEEARQSKQHVWVQQIVHSRKKVRKKSGKTAARRYFAFDADHRGESYRRLKASVQREETPETHLTHCQSSSKTQSVDLSRKLAVREKTCDMLSTWSYCCCLWAVTAAPHTTLTKATVTLLRPLLLPSCLLTYHILSHHQSLCWWAYTPPIWTCVCASLCLLPLVLHVVLRIISFQPSNCFLL